MEYSMETKQECYKCSYWKPPEIMVGSTATFTQLDSELNASTPYFECFWKCEREVNRKKENCLSAAESIEQAKGCYNIAKEEYSRCFEICDKESSGDMLAPALQPLPGYEKEKHLKADKFRNKISTQLDLVTPEDLKEVKNLRLGIEDKGMIDFGSRAIDISNADLDQYVSFGEGSVTIDSNRLPELDAPATITLNDVHLTNPSILKDGKACSECRIISYDKNSATLVFTVPGFTTYAAVNGSATGIGTLDLAGGSFPVYVDLATGDIAVDLNADGDVAGDETKITVFGGGIIDLGGAVPGAMTLTTERAQIQGADADEDVDFSFVDSGSKLGISLLSQSSLNMTYSKEKKSYMGMTRYGALFEIEDDTYSNNLVIDYPARGQRYANVGVSVNN